ncbi:hypothetical protein VOLCADRAFT_94727 [Volvox carteri f. nagariensis]|uniref:UBA domain-containing protein n=1 Tax=Volvox carteri f. nagariensis TaxID=3068 RepID=D8U5K8_VOLCA|nr:uncharacterized protein VOLCADRAFT_94727 [Volvox carteri f. nagariensis]EFJ45019.1 hypothetical protein VOLCADRAFT_94727 [Volvox carteri f. nagariensis]|eukprot:XP_002953990.1 hypothetical protein VOLCADRAFT_94727 [Volvox carteri f. nagariensis]
MASAVSVHRERQTMDQLDDNGSWENVASHTGTALAALSVEDTTGSRGDAPLYASPPVHWQPFDSSNSHRVEHHVLPLKSDPLGGTVRGTFVSLEAAEVHALMETGINRVDAEKLLLYCNGDVHSARDLAVKARSLIGVLLSNGPNKAAGATEEADDVVAKPAAAESLALEMERVLGRFEARPDIPQAVVCIRILVMSSCRRAQIPASRERYLWCAVSTKDVCAVVMRGFNAAGLGREPLFMANAALALDKAGEVERELARFMPTSAAEQPALEAGPAMLPEPMNLATSQGSSLWRRIVWQPKSLWPFRSADYPGKGGVLLLCRVVLGRMELGRSDSGELTPGADSVMDMKTVAASVMQRNAAASAAGAGGWTLPSTLQSAEDPAWEANGMYANDLAVELRHAGAQAYPEYIVHFD